ncbi:MAG TPA: plasmid pRiA4b ORF-3 family protein [Candidatus Obscuribacterales bacterium]
MSVAKRSIGTTKAKAGAATKRKKPSMYKLKVTLMDAPLPIWRRLLVRSDVTLDLLHEILQIAMGWWNYHLHAFRASGDRHFGDLKATTDEPDMKAESKYTLADLLSAPEEEFMYEYDFGDGWQHRVVLEQIITTDDLVLAACIAGKRACPPEDVGGVYGYANFLEKVEDPENEEGLDLLEWAGGDFDADSFDMRTVNLRLVQLQNVLAGE